MVVTFAVWVQAVNKGKKGNAKQLRVQMIWDRNRGKRSAVTYRVYNPAERMVDDSLKEVLYGEVSITQHYRFVMEDSLLASFPSSRCNNKWLTWCCASGGNLLHACALWNNVDTARRLVTIDRLDKELTGASNSEGRTPYEVAVLTGHSQVRSVLEALGADKTNYVVDIYCLDNTGSHPNEERCRDGTGGNDTDKHPQQSPASSMLSFQLEGGVGYWDEQGELVFELSDQ